MCLDTLVTRDNLLVSSSGVRDELLPTLSGVDAKSHVPIEFVCGCTFILGVIPDVDCV